MILNKLLEKLENFAPVNLSENDSWDNSGLQIGDKSAEIKKILLCMDITKEVVKTAETEDFNCIISHHPLIFKGIKCFDMAEYKSSLIAALIKSEINVISMHTNLDAAKFGVNYALCKKLELSDTSLLYESGIYDNEPYGYGLIGNLKNKMNLDTLSKFTKDKLNAAALRYAGEPDRIVKRVAVCGGSGSSFIKAAVNKGAEAYITGDIGHHDAQQALENDLMIIDAGHFDTEKHVLPELKKYIDKISEKEIITKIFDNNPFKFIAV